MKRWLVFFVLVLVALVLLPYIFIPAAINISALVKIGRNTAGTGRSLDKTSDWAKWWPKKNAKVTPENFQYNGLLYSVSGKYYNALKITIHNATDSFESKINLLPLNRDSTYISWNYTMPTGGNPFNRVINYRKAVSQQADLNELVAQLRSFVMKDQNVYGIEIKQGMSKDSTLLVTSFQTKTYPTVNEVYRSISELKGYISDHQAQETNYPMLMNKHLPDGSYEAMVAIPTSKSLPEKGKIVLRHFVPWKIIYTEVNGGDSVVERSLRQFRNYLSDNQFQQMAQPYQSLITDRHLEPDTSKWVTRFICAIP